MTYCLVWWIRNTFNHLRRDFTPYITVGRNARFLVIFVEIGWFSHLHASWNKMCIRIAKTTQIPRVSINNTSFKPNLTFKFRFLLTNMTLQNLVHCHFLWSRICRSKSAQMMYYWQKPRGVRLFLRNSGSFSSRTLFREKIECFSKILKTWLESGISSHCDICQ